MITKSLRLSDIKANMRKNGRMEGLPNRGYASKYGKNRVITVE